MMSASEQMGTTEPPYNLSFTSGDLLVAQTLIVAEEYGKTNDWDATIKSVESQNLLQARTASTSKRILREVYSRLKLLTEIQLGLLQRGSRSDSVVIAGPSWGFAPSPLRELTEHSLAVSGVEYENNES